MSKKPIAAALAAALMLVACESVPDSGNSGVGGGNVNYALEGTGGPVVVMEAGLGDGKDTWSPVYEDISAFSTTFAYDRPGYEGGLAFLVQYDTDKDGRRTGRDVAENLHALLAKEQVAPPYVLVGHSIGGTYVLNFASMYPDDVAGIVLVDGRLPGFTEACKAADVGLCEPPAIATLMAPWHQKLELSGIKETERDAASARQLGDIPITVIAATEPAPLTTAASQRLWLEQQEAYANAAQNGRFVRADGSKHYIHKEKPDLVIAEVKRMVESLR